MRHLLEMPFFRRKFFQNKPQNKILTLAKPVSLPTLRDASLCKNQNAFPGDREAAFIVFSLLFIKLHCLCLNHINYEKVVAAENNKIV